MKAASLKLIKTELDLLHPEKVKDLCLQLIKFRKENKELLSYLLFDSVDEQAYIKDVKLELDEYFKDINKSNLYLAKKTIRKILRIANKQIKYSDSKQTEVEILIYFCKELKKSKVPLQNKTVLGNIYQRQIIKIEKALATLHEDLQFDYSEEIKTL
ncbi:MAG: hypothetical protein WCL51_12240 [Bacteroidota bacterium]